MIYRFKLLTLMALSVAGGLPCVSGAQTNAPSDSAPADSAAPDHNAVIESARQTVRDTTLYLARGIDSWFGDRPFEDGGKISNARLDVGLLKRNGETLEVSVRFNARVRLPNLERLAYVVVGRDDPRELVTDQPGALSSQDRLHGRNTQDPTFFAGLGRTINDAVDVRLGVRGALKVYAQARAQHQWQLSDTDKLDLRQTFFWTLDDRFGSTTAAALQHDLSPRLALRWVGAATVTQDLPKFVWASNLGAYQSFGTQRLLSIEAVANGRQGSGVGALDYGLQLGWEQPLYRQWLLGSVMVGRFWPRPDVLAVRKGSWGFGAGLKMRL